MPTEQPAPAGAALEARVAALEATVTMLMKERAATIEGYKALYAEMKERDKAREAQAAADQGRRDWIRQRLEREGG